VATGDPRTRAQALDGGAGNDTLGGVYLVRLGGRDDSAVYDVGSGTIDLATGTVRGRAGRDRFELRAVSFSDLETPLGTWTVFGTEGANDIIGGDEKHSVTIHARGGDDHLSGTFTDDVLDGGPGHDEASGYVGHDRYVSVEKIRR